MDNLELPSFLGELEPQLPGEPTSEPVYRNAVFYHKSIPAAAHALWWPGSKDCRTILVMIPGNPGLVDFYTPFLTAIHNKTHGRLPILAHSHAGHTPRIPRKNKDQNQSFFGLTAQVEHLLEVVDTVKLHYDRIVLAGHSMGCWLILQALKERPNSVDSLLMLFPTISHILDTPNGHSMSASAQNRFMSSLIEYCQWIFRSPLPLLISYLSVATRLIPLQVLSKLFSDWPTSQLLVLRTLLHSPSAVYNSLSLAHQEMETIRDVEAGILQKYSHRIHMYFAEDDKWVGKQKDAIIKVFEHDPGNIKVVHGGKDIPHAFCINHGEELAEQCHEWLLAGDFYI